MPADKVPKKKGGENRSLPPTQPSAAIEDQSHTGERLEAEHDQRHLRGRQPAFVRQPEGVVKTRARHRVEIPRPCPEGVNEGATHPEQVAGQCQHHARKRKLQAHEEHCGERRPFGGACRRRNAKAYQRHRYAREA